jgi:hypothetical protein
VYRVTYSGRVREAFLELVIRNPDHESSILTAAQEIDRRLQIYPQFGQPLRNLSVEPAQLWIATLPPLCVHYILLDYDEAVRAATGFDGEVMVVRPFQPLTGSGII